MALKFDPVNNNFLVYEAVPLTQITLPIYDKPFDISDFAVNVKEDEIPEAIDTFKGERKNLRIVDIPEEVEPTISEPAISEQPIETLPAAPKKAKEKPLMNLTELANRARYAYDFFISKGLNNYAARGIVGNLMHESNLDPFENTGDNGKALGIAQWQPPRLKGLKKLAEKRGTDITDFDTLLEYVWEELNSPNYKKVLDGLLTATNVSDATKLFMEKYEISKIQAFSSRLNHANSIK